MHPSAPPVTSLATASFRRVASQPQRSSSVRGTPLAILVMFCGGWNWIKGTLSGRDSWSKSRGRLTSSPSIYGKLSLLARNWATVDFPQPAGPMMSQMWRRCFEGEGEEEGGEGG